MSGIMRSRLSVTSANRAPRTLSRLRIIYIILNGRNRHGAASLVRQAAKRFIFPQPPRGLIGVRKRMNSLLAAVPQLAHFVCCVPRPTTRGGGSWFCWCLRLPQWLCHLVSSAKPRAVGLVGGSLKKKRLGFAERVKSVSDRVCQRAQPIKAKPFGREAALTVLRALAVVNH